MDQDSGFDWGSAIMVGNEIAQQWYSLVTQKPLPSQEGVVLGPTGGRVTVGTNTIILVALVAVAAVLIYKA